MTEKQGKPIVGVDRAITLDRNVYFEVGYKGGRMCVREVPPIQYHWLEAIQRFWKWRKNW